MTCRPGGPAGGECEHVPGAQMMIRNAEAGNEETQSASSFSLGPGESQGSVPPRHELVCHEGVLSAGLGLGLSALQGSLAKKTFGS